MLAPINHYLQLCKPRVVLLMILTSMVGMCLATPDRIPWNIIIWGNLGIALSASSAASINHLLERHLDRLMQRTHRRPLAQGVITPRSASIFALILCALSLFILIYWVNALTAMLTFLTVIGYAGIYTLYLKHATPQNIVIGGIAGAAPPMLGWVAVTGTLDPRSLILMAIIFIWTPPHFWALAIHRIEDYRAAHIPMLPNTHGIPYTKLNIVLYTLLLLGITSLPYCIMMSGIIYLVGATLLNLLFISLALRLYYDSHNSSALLTFHYSIWYLMLLFLLLLIDHYYPY